MEILLGTNAECTRYFSYGLILIANFPMEKIENY
jgi:hypothetical protein